MRKSIEIVVEMRNQVGVHESNCYVFACSMPHSMTHIRGSDTLRKHSVQCAAKSPEKLRSINLRHHIATISQLVNMKDNELDILAKFMGHDIRIHSNYRLPQETIQVAEVSKILLNLEKGKATSQLQDCDDGE